MPILRILHLVGSAYNDFYCNLSRDYAQSCLLATANPSLYEFLIAYVTPDSQWRFPSSLSQEDIAVAKPMSLLEAIQFITAQNIDLVLPQMVCIPGMTHYRALFDLLKIPYIGNTPDVMAIANHKAITKAIVAAAGVKVPFGELLREGDVPTITPPAVIKPATAADSLGVSLVKEVTDYDAALKKAFEYGDEVIVEAFIEPGREVRCGIIVKDGELIALPLEEYLVDPDDRPIRSYSDKFKKDPGDSQLRSTAKKYVAGWIVDSNDPIVQKVQQEAKKCHLALGCRNYSLFDFRIDQKGEPWFIEAGLYCLFYPKSVIVNTANAAGIPLNELFMTAINETLRMT